MTEEIIKAAAKKHDLTIKVEYWDDFPIHFVQINNDWPVVAKDVAAALDYSDAEHLTRRIPAKYKLTPKLGVNSQGGKIILLTEPGIYKAVFGSHKPEAEQFQDWVYQVIKQLRRQTGLQGYEAFKMLDTRIQKQAMQRLDANNKVDYIKANSIANKAIANKYGLPKMISKNQMTSNMKRDRPTVLNDVVDLMNAKKRFNLDISVSKTIYDNLKKQSR
ncbi:Bro-N domain-containing protein [Limosilactobacillus mucosae]|uniref:BRO-N domain-containing protein n=1 Tax=Limosilactobacillus mucosae TaxID=97478 RepID=UPI003995AA42